MMMIQLDEKFWYALVVVLLTIFIYSLYWYGYGRFQYFKKMGIPGIEPQWFIGNTLNIRGDYKNAYEHINDLILKHGRKTLGIYFWGLPMYIVTDVQIVKEITTGKFDCFRDRMMYYDRPYPFNLMLGWMIGDRWKTLRAKLAPSFTTGKIKMTMGLLNKAGDSGVEILENGIKNNKEVSLRKVGTGFSTEAILLASFGLEAKNQSDMNKRIIDYGVNFFTGQGVWWYLMQWLPLSGHYMQYIPNPMVGAIKEIHEDVKILFQQRKQEKVKKKDFFQFMLDTQGERFGMTDDEIFGSSCNFMAAGQETAGNTLSAALYEITKHADVQQKIYEEIKELWPDTSKQLQYDQVDGLKYLDMVIKETFRMYPPTPWFLRACKKECEIRGLKFKPYTYVYIPTYTIHRDPKAYEKPNEFYPEHFTEEACKNRDDAYWLPFGYGPRICLGYKFALLEIKVAISRIVRKYQLSPGDDFPSKLAIIQRITNTVEDLVNAKVVKRNDS